MVNVSLMWQKHFTVSTWCCQSYNEQFDVISMSKDFNGIQTRHEGDTHKQRGGGVLAVCNDAGLNCNIYRNHTFHTPVIHKDPEKLELRDCNGPLISVSKACSQCWPSHERNRFEIKGMLHQNVLTHGSAVNAAKLCLRLCVVLLQPWRL